VVLKSFCNIRATFLRVYIGKVFRWNEQRMYPFSHEALNGTSETFCGLFVAHLMLTGSEQANRPIGNLTLSCNSMNAQQTQTLFYFNAKIKEWGKKACV
jgi:hypothetical protein